MFRAGEAGAFPNAARVVTRWFPAGERGFARGAITTTSMLGGAIVSAARCRADWLRWLAMDLCGLRALGVVWSVLFYWWFRDDPAEFARARGNYRTINRAGNAANTRKRHTSRFPGAKSAPAPTSGCWASIMTVGATLFYMQFQWYPTYLKEARGLSEQASGWFTGAIIAGGALGCLVGGLVADFVTRHIANRRWRRACAAR